MAKIFGVHEKAPNTNFTAFTPTGSWVTNCTYTGEMRRIGDCLEFNVNIALTGAPNATSLQINLPSGLVIDTAKLPGFGNSAITPPLGKMTFTCAGVARVGSADYNISTQLGTFYQAATTATVSAINATTPGTFASGDNVMLTSFRIPIVGWSANDILNPATDIKI